MSFAMATEEGELCFPLSADGIEENDVQACKFCYLLCEDRLEDEWNNLPDTQLAAELYAVFVCAHEIRHEIQAVYEFSEDQMYATVPDPADLNALGLTIWAIAERIMEEYESRTSDSERLARERDAIIVSLTAVLLWISAASVDYSQRLEMLSQLIQSEAA